MWEHYGHRRFKNVSSALFEELCYVPVHRHRVPVRVHTTDLPDAAEVVDDRTRRLLVRLEPFPDGLLVVIASTTGLSPVQAQHPP